MCRASSACRAERPRQSASRFPNSVRSVAPSRRAACCSRASACEAERLGGLEVDGELEPRRLFDGQVG